MLEVRCHTNLDLDNHEVWPCVLPVVPHVGDVIVSNKMWKGGFRLELQVISITWTPCDNCWTPRIELYMTNYQKQMEPQREGAATGSIIAFYEWYAPLVGRSVGSFI